MTVCSTTGITVPECSCQDCLTALIERHSPSLLDGNPVITPSTLEMPAVARIPRVRFSRLRRLRRAA
jgi:hypothetical protein